MSYFPHLPKQLALSELGVTERTYNRWKQQSRAPKYAHALAEIYNGGRLLPKDWIGWRFINGRLYSPEGSWFDPSFLRLADFMARNGIFNRYDLPTPDELRESNITDIRSLMRSSSGAEPEHESPRNTGSGRDKMSL